MNIRNLNPALERELKSRAAAAGLSLRELLEQVLGDWLKQAQARAPEDDLKYMSQDKGDR